MKALLALCFLVSLTACAPSAASIGTAIAQTQGAAPTLTPVPSVTVTASLVPSAIPMAAPSATATSIPTATPTLVPLAKLDLESILIQPGDLPAGITGGQIGNTATGIFSSLPPAAQVADEQLATNGSQIGYVDVFLYDSLKDVQTAYGMIVDGFRKEAVTFPGIGEAAQVGVLDTTSLGGLISANLAFTRCQSVISVLMTGDVNKDSVGNYAKRLDARLQPLVCR